MVRDHWKPLNQMVEWLKNHRKTIESNDMEAVRAEAEKYLTLKPLENHWRLESKNHQIRWLASQNHLTLLGPGEGGA